MNDILHQDQQVVEVNSFATPKRPEDLIELLRKLRWIGLDDEAERLQRDIPASRRACVLSWPASTD